MKNLTFLLVLLSAFSLSALAQDNSFSVSKVPTVADKPDQFAQSGWKVEEVVKGDLNGDGQADAAIKLAQIEAGREGGIGGDRVLVVAFNDAGKWKRVAVANKLLQCVDCGGAFYGVMPAPAGVTIAKGILQVENEHGSRNVDTSTFKFRYEKDSGRFVLIGYDFTDNDRNTGAWAKESTNYSTHSRITERGGTMKASSKRAIFKPVTIYLEDADGDEIEGQALKRLGLD